MTSADDLLALTCPRCGSEVSERFYGPCSACRAELRDSQAGEEGELVTERFEPTMHVTPNAVALKD